MKRALLFSSLCFLLTPTVFSSGCVSCWAPSDLKPDKPLEVQATGEFPKAQTQILVDDKGVPHIYADDEKDAVYGLGYMHARERQFQMLFSKFASQGRLTELLGADLLEADQFLRLISYAGERQLAALSERELEMLNAYCEGANTAAAEYGNTAEMAISGANWEDFTPYDVVTIALLFIDDQSAALFPELMRNLVQNRIPADDPRSALLLQKSPNGNVPIVTPQTHSGPQEAKVSRGQSNERLANKNNLDELMKVKRKDPLAKLEPEHRKLLRNLLTADGASNSWVVSGRFTQSGAAILTNDPHLGHSAPGIFYMVHFDTGENGTIAGVTFPGLPTVLIGHGRDMAWGITNAYGDCQDLVRVQSPDDNPDVYELDGEMMPFGTLTQSYKLGDSDDAEVVSEEWKTTVFGPLLPEGRDFLYDEGDQLAYLWCSDKYAADYPNIFTSFWDMANSANIEEADAALGQFLGPPLNVAMAFTDGTIAYRLAGRFPERLSEESSLVPRDGRFSSAGWGELLPHDIKPQLTNPESGFIVAANQRITTDEGPLARAVGGESARPYRAMRIHERLAEMLDENDKVSADDLLGIQQDVQSIQARRFAPILGRHCPRTIEGQPNQRVQWFCEAVRTFDGEFNKESTGALPYDRFYAAFMKTVMEAHVGEDGARVAGVTSIAMAVEEAMIQAESGVRSPLLDDVSTEEYEGLEGFAAKAAKVALDDIYENFGPTPVEWRWGRVHQIQFKGRLSEVAVIGGSFETDLYEESGCGTCVRAESGYPVSFGAGLRLSAEMTETPRVRMVIDTGQSGHFGSKHLEDLYPLWSAGMPFQVVKERNQVASALDGVINISPK